MAGELPHVELYTDGACSGNPGPGGWAFILRHRASKAEKECSGGELETTNNRMELMSVIRGLEALDRACQVDIYSDSQYVVKGLREWMDDWKRKGWKRGRNEPVKNIDLWQELDELRQKHQINYHWIRGHNAHPENERADRLAVAAIEKVKNTAN